ncbi:MAG: hypothetical protein U0M60_05100 [Clostridia bacterium]|nr:hypothetical protein [Clostridia bacterium]
MDKVKAIFRRVIWEAVMLSAASLLFMFFAGQYVAPLFIKPEDTELLKVSIIGMKLFSLSYLTGGWICAFLLISLRWSDPQDLCSLLSLEHSYSRFLHCVLWHHC